MRAAWIGIVRVLPCGGDAQGVKAALCRASEHPAAWEGLNFVPQLQSPISLFPVNDIIAYIKPLKHVSFICLISNSEHTSWKLCLIVKLKTFGFPFLAEICSEYTSYLVEFLSNHFYTAIEASQKTKRIILQNQITSVQASNTSYISLPPQSCQDTTRPDSLPSWPRSLPGASSLCRTRASTPRLLRARGRTSLSVHGKNVPLSMKI